MMTIDIDTISGVPFDRRIEDGASEYVGADQKSEQEDDHRGGC